MNPTHKQFSLNAEANSYQYLVAGNKSSQCHQASASQLPPVDRFRIGPHKKLGFGVVTTCEGNQIIFSKDLAEATWHRYHGMRQATHRLLVAHGITPSEPLPHQMPSSYVKPGRKIYPQNWIDCPNPFRAPAFIAAAIHCYCRSYSCLGLNLP